MYCILAWCWIWWVSATKYYKLSKFSRSLILVQSAPLQSDSTKFWFCEEWGVIFDVVRIISVCICACLLQIAVDMRSHPLQQNPETPVCLWMVSYMRTGTPGTTDVAFVTVMGVRRCVPSSRAPDPIVASLCSDWVIAAPPVLVSTACFQKSIKTCTSLYSSHL